jgi:HEAT repeat protein
VPSKGEAAGRFGPLCVGGKIRATKADGSHRSRASPFFQHAGFVLLAVKERSSPVRPQPRHLLLILAATLLAAAPPPVEDWQEPALNGKRLTEWIDLLLEEDGGVRINAASVLIGFGPAAFPAVPALALTLKDEYVDARIYAAEALRAIGPKAEEAIPALLEALKDKNPSVRTTSARALFAVSPAHASESAGALASIFEQKHEGDRIRAAEALEEIGPKAAGVVPALKKVLNDPTTDRSVKAAVASALKRIAVSSGHRDDQERGVDSEQIEPHNKSLTKSAG